MREYPKIQSLFKRDMESKEKKLIVGEWTLPEFAYLQNNQWLWSEKVDGCSIRIIWDEGRLSLKGRTDKAVIQPNLLPTLERLFTLDLMEKHFSGADEVCLYGEGYGQKIQKVGAQYIPDDTSFILFDVTVGRWQLTREACEAVAEDLGIDIVPIIGEGTLHEAIELVRGGFKSTNSCDTDLQAEGLVVKPKVDLFSRDGRRIISKVKTRDF